MIITANGNQFDTRLEGPEGAPVVIMSHSLCCDLGAWDELAEDLKKEYRVLRYSLRGHGKSAATPGPYDFALLAADMTAIQEHYGITESHIVGLSIGGMIAQEFALRYPDRVKSLVISSSMCALPDGAAALWPERIRLAAEEGLAATVDASMSRWFVEGSLKDRPEIEARIRKMILETSVEGYVGCCHAIAGIDLKDRIPAIKVPTLVIVGREDMGTPVSSSELIHRQIEGSRLVVVDNAAHQLAVDKPGIFNAEVCKHLATAV
ncbi:MAG: 3-oxoadipate enol-lactonase [Sneathiella sp.]|jgi:3-oxoadipate enol-lactonase|uniref:alpha/beta fold hydrolase n=1 Tax=Sneathiella sp. TaxID=1964365 RepID=UPI000C5ED84A|nr:alpha/beta fold hydrolase [Sneathiella sp.]MAL78317.1 3-oxoadipate enol-lactonase [Sneathiella sp.]|tara:strand:+ start:613 stop:1404 length:792 start_codon:yes stop_codon:yes gene_type:complete